MNYPQQGFPPFNPYEQPQHGYPYEPQHAYSPPQPPAQPAQAWGGLNLPPVTPPPTAADEYAAAGVDPARLAAFARLNQATNPQDYARLAQEAGLTASGWQAAAGQVAAGVAPGPVQAPSFDDQVAEYRQRAAAAEAQVQSMNFQYQNAIAALQQQVGALMGAIPTRVDPVAESAAKVARAFADIVHSDAKRILHSALHSHLVNLGLVDLAKLL